MSLSGCATSHCCVYSISIPHLGYLNHKGECFISLLGEEGGSCLSKRACWIKGVISPEGGVVGGGGGGGIRARVSLTQALTYCFFLSFHHVVRGVLLLSPPLSVFFPSWLPSPHLLPLLVQCCPTGNRELLGSVGWLLFQSHLRCSEGPVKYRIIGRFQTAFLL